jgi:hypothetical protein
VINAPEELMKARPLCDRLEAAFHENMFKELIDYRTEAYQGSSTTPSNCRTGAKKRTSAPARLMSITFVVPSHLRLILGWVECRSYLNAARLQCRDVAYWRRQICKCRPC